MHFIGTIPTPYPHFTSIGEPYKQILPATVSEDSKIHLHCVKVTYIQ